MEKRISIILKYNPTRLYNPHSEYECRPLKAYSSSGNALYEWIMEIYLPEFNNNERETAVP